MNAQKRQTASAGTAETVMALLSYFSVLCFIPLLKKKKSDFVAYHLNQGLVLFVLEFCLGALFSLLALVLRFAFPTAYTAVVFLFGACGLFFLLCHIIGIVRVIRKEQKKIPLFGEIRLYKPEKAEESEAAPEE